MAPVRRFDDHAARNDAVEIPLQFFRFSPDFSLDSLGRVHVAKGDLHWDLHVRTSLARSVP
jgi:hypothetical protein